MRTDNWGLFFLWASGFCLGWSLHTLLVVGLGR
jgi:hypothetical protein